MILKVIRNIIYDYYYPTLLGRWGYHFNKIKHRNYYD
uniref:Uncharacterized protein n=1 Tax=viral metagenome TaxID=1070528 RepID=A0A6C0H037_9ZZZZ